MRRAFTILLILALALCAPAQAEGRFSIVCATFPCYDWVMNVLGGEADAFDVSLLLDNGVDLHSYQPTADDIIRISSCDLFVYVGGESDLWVTDALRGESNPDRIVVTLMDALGDSVREEELVEGMQAEEAEEDAEEAEPEYDEHIWLSLRNAQALTRALADALSEIDPTRAERFRANAEEYCGKLAELDERFAAAAASAQTDTLLFGDRFPFRYLMDDYGLTYYAAFAGCSAETEASFETIVFLAGKVDELGLRHVCVIESSDGRIANTIISSTQSRDQDVIAFDSMQAVTRERIDAGETYLSIMENNLAALTAALN